MSTAQKRGFPITYEDEVDLFRDDLAKLLLAWLRVLNDGTDEARGWVVVLERAGYTHTEIKHVLSSEANLPAITAFHNEIGGIETVSTVAHQVLVRYGYDGPSTEVLSATIQSVYHET